MVMTPGGRDLTPSVSCEPSQARPLVEQNVCVTAAHLTGGHWRYSEREQRTVRTRTLPKVLQSMSVLRTWLDMMLVAHQPRGLVVSSQTKSLKSQNDY